MSSHSPHAIIQGVKRLLDLEKHGIEACASALAEVLSSGGLVVFPTDTVYGLAASVDHLPALRRVFALKGRGREKSLVIMPPSIGEAELLLAQEILPRLRRLAPFWPGGLTVVARRREGFSWMEAAAPGRETLGLRIPDHPLALALLNKAGPLAVTSANPTGREPPRTFEAIDPAVIEGVEAACRSRFPGSGLPSTIIELSEEGVELLRPGPVDIRLIREALQEEQAGN